MTKALRILALLLMAFPAFAQAPRSYSQAELDQMLAPIALYPDPLLSQVLMAATYPLEVAEAARWSRANPGLQGDDAVRAAGNEAWDPSVKSLLAFPQILARMDENRAWTQSLGDAFLVQEPQVMDTVQQLRRRAQAAGNLQSSEQLAVQQQGQTIVLQPASPQYIYVPYYDPLLVYGPWWWPAYRPVVWAPWPRPVGVYLSVNFFFGNFDWRHRHVRVVYPHAYYYRPPLAVSRTVVVAPDRWQHDPAHRRGVSYRMPEVRQPAPQRPQQRTEQREDHRAERQEAAEAQRQELHKAQESQRRAQRQAQAAQRQARQEPRANMPAAQAPQQPRAERQEPRRERPEKRDPRQERAQKG